MKRKLRVGDKILEFGQVFRVFKIENKKNGNGEPERTIHFRPYFKSNDNKGMTCSIPEDSLGQTNIRRPISLETARSLIEKLSQKPKGEMSTDVDSIKQTLGQNDPHETARVVRSLWVEKLDGEITFTKSKKDMFELATSRLVEEVAYVIKTPPENAYSKIKAALEKGNW